MVATVSMLRIGLQVGANVVSTVGVVLLNKYLWSRLGFTFVLFLSGLHFLFTGVCVSLLHTAKYVAFKDAGVRDVLPLALGSLGSVAFMNLSLATNSVSLYQLSKLLCIPVTLVLEYITQGETVSWGVLLTLGVLLSGVGLATVDDLSNNMAGTLFAVAAILFTVTSQILTRAVQTDLGLNALQLLYHVAPIISASMFLCVPAFDKTTGHGGLLQYVPSVGVVLLVLCTCALAAVVNITNYMIVGSTGPITYQIVGHLKTCLILLFGVVLFDRPQQTGHPSSPIRIVAGILLAVGAIIAYFELKRREHVKATADAAVDSAALEPMLLLLRQRSEDGASCSSNEENKL